MRQLLQKKVRESYILYAIPAIVIFAVLYIIRGAVWEDDAYIFYRYAANWAAGHGPVFNINEYVEGYSSLLWTAVLAVWALFSSDLVNAAFILNLFVGIICLFLVSYLSSFIKFSNPRFMAIALPMFCALSYGFYYFGASGMDTLLFSLVLLFSIGSLYKNKDTGNYLLTLPSLFLLNIVRAEGPLYSIVILSVFTYFIFIKQKNIPKKLIAAITLFLGFTALLFMIRYSIYNELVPATVMAKGYATYLFKQCFLNGEYQVMREFITVILSGLKYEEFLLYIGAWIPFIVLMRNKDKNNVFLWLIASAILVNIFVSVWAGGDYFPHKRQFIPVLPLLVIFVAWGMDSLLNRYWNGLLYKKVVLSIAVMLILAAWVVFFIKPAVDSKYAGHDENFYLGSQRTELIRQLGTLLHDMPDSMVMLSSMIGEISYYAGSRVYVRDVFGLTDIHNAKYGDTWTFDWGIGVCGRIDYMYSFSTPFDIYFNNSPNLHKVYISFCKKDPALCKKYRFFSSEKWPESFFYVIADINHPVSKALKEKFNAVALPIDEKLLDLMRDDES